MEYIDKWGHFSLSVCLFFGFARTPGAAQYFVSTVALVGSGTVRITITAPRFKPISVAKSTDADAALHTGNERMIVEGSHFTGKRKSQLPSLYLSTPTNVGRGCHNAEPLVWAPGWCVLVDCGAKAFDSICAVGCSYKVQSWQSFVFSKKLEQS